MARHQNQAADAGGCRRAAGLGHARDRKPRCLGLVGTLFQNIDGGHVWIEQIERWKVARQQRLVGQSGEAILGRGARHGDRALGQNVEAVALDIVGGDHRLLFADEHAQAHIVAFGPLGFFHGAVAHLDGERDAAHRNGIGCICARALSRGDQSFGEVAKGGLIEE